MPRPTLILLLTLILLFSKANPAAAQTPTPASGPIYIVQPGDTLSAIAARFNVTLQQLMDANGIADPDRLSAGKELVIPGLEGVSGVLVTEVVPFGESFRSLSRRTQVPADLLRRLNRLVSPTELYVGVSLIVPQQETQTDALARMTPSPGESLFELAVRQGADTWTLAQFNGLSGTWDALPGDVLYSPTGASAQNANGLPAVYAAAEVGPLPLKQGGTAVISIALAAPATLSGNLVDMPLRFFPTESGSYVALQGIHALLEPGVYPLSLTASLPDGSTQTFAQMVLIASGNYRAEKILVNDPATIDPQVSASEQDQILAIVAEATPERRWTGIFRSPAVYQEYTSYFGNRRTYTVQGSDLTVEGFHSGLDFAGGEGLPISAPAPGVVVFTGPLTVRGIATIIDHGWGVYSGYWHQSRSDVQVGQKVETGQTIGLVGGTGRVTGAHLHWEIWVNGIQVDPLDWLNRGFP